MYSLRSTFSRIRAAAARSLLFLSNPGQQGQEKLLQVTCSEARQQFWSGGARPAARSISWESRRRRSVGKFTGAQQQDGTFYELRTYTIQPGKMADFLKLTGDHIHLRTAHSELFGYWSVEIGCLNEVFHIWKYGSYADRAGVRAALAKEQEWQQNYISKMLPMLVNQASEIAYLVPWVEISTVPKGGIYELICYHMVPGGPAVWGNAFQKAISAHDHVGYCKLIGVFHNEFGELNKVHALWWHQNGDTRAAGRRKAQEDVRVVAAVRDSVSYLASQSNKLLIPTPYSPLK
uniref:protein NipSnap homolog 3A isoform X2 n=1 Tax=Pristiophorus japonicus TaxID=55135 RepID=UPI00398EEF63